MVTFSSFTVVHIFKKKDFRPKHLGKKSILSIKVLNTYRVLMLKYNMCAVIMYNG